ncbi:MAG: HPP family protein [Hyphomicrobiaceae bacterium]|nr:HPP family protein [Hyphomicrobiaceae bacterium]MCC0009812.1 HPP family protein [Hyphomicrobiaceae bacterium]
MKPGLSENFQRLVGIELAPVSHFERFISGVGGFLGIAIIVLLERGVLGEVGAAIMVASMGSSAVLLFAVPHAASSQPWAVIVGHIVSAIVGVACAKFVGDIALASALAVGLSISAMYYMRAIHPPGGATALTAVIGGSQVHALGFQFVLTPVLVNTLIIVSVAVAVNAFFAWRRYPAGLSSILLPETPTATNAGDAFSHSDFVSALEKIGTFVDISEEEFLELRSLMRQAAANRHLKRQDIKLGAYYSNGGEGDALQVKRIVDAAPNEDGDVIWCVIAGKQRGMTGVSRRQEFADWAAYEVTRASGTSMRQSFQAIRTSSKTREPDLAA